MAHHNALLAQLLKLVPRHEFEQLAHQVDGFRRPDAMSRWTQFVSMMTAQLAGRRSLRDVESTLASQSHLHYHLGIGPVRRTTLARMNQSLDAAFYEQLFGLLYQHCQKLGVKKSFRLKRKLFSLDASLLDVSMKVFPQAEYNRMKAAYKLHIGLDHDGLIPAFAAVTVGKVSDQTQARWFQFPKGSVVVFDRGYADYKWHNTLTDQGIFWVSRLRSNAKYRVIQRRKVDRSSGVTSDQIIEYTSARSKANRLSQVRRIGYYDQNTQRHYQFITNHVKWSAKTVAQLYKQRWQVELFFKWIKQHLKIKSFLGNTDNAVMTQVFVALCAYLLLAFFKFTHQVHQSLMQISRLIQVNLFARRVLVDLFKPPPDPKQPHPQMALIP